MIKMISKEYKIVYDGNKNKGSICINTIDDREQISSISYEGCMIRTLETERAYENKGYASSLMNLVIKRLEHCHRISVLAYPTNYSICPIRLRNFYKKFGFEPSFFDKIDLYFNKNKRGVWLHRQKPE